MPAQLRRYQDQGSHHFITFSCHQRLPLLNSDPVRVTFEHHLEQLRIRHGFFVFGYVLMPEHVHLLLSEPKRYQLATTLNVLKTSVAKEVKGHHERLWLTRYHDFNVITQPKHIQKLRYMHRNPVERGLVTAPEHWAWSSFNHYATGLEGRVEIESEWTWKRRERASSHP